MSGPLAGKVALVAGATRGAGRGIAIALGEAGATVFCTGRAPGRSGRSTTGPRRSRRPPSWSTPPAAPGSPSRSTTSSRTTSRSSSSASTTSRLEIYGVTEDNWREATIGSPHFNVISETRRFVGRAVAALAADPDVHARNGGSFSAGALAREYGFTDVDGSQPDCWRYMVEIQDPGLPPDATGYR